MRSKVPLAVIVFLGAVSAGACDSHSPLQRVPPTAPEASRTTTLPPPGEVQADLAISDFTVREVANPGYLGYLETFALVETSGRSGATVTNIESHADSSADTEVTGEICWRNKIRVEPKSTSDTFKRPEALVYCAPYAASRTKAHRVWIIVTFTDDDGRMGTVEASAEVK